MGYDPFARGPHAVALHSGIAVDHARDDRTLAYDVRHPANAVAGVLPLVVFSHTSFGRRRQSTFLLDHLASRGYVVAAADHAGNAADDLATHMAGAATRSDAEREAYISRIIADRVPDLRFLADTVLATGPVPADAGRMGSIGWSFGGWAALAVPEVDDRFGAVVAMTPAGSSSPRPGIIPAPLTFAYRGDARVLYLAAGDDPYTPVPGIVELVGRTPTPARLFVLDDAGHDHFGDAPQERPPRVEIAQGFARALTLAHFDTTLRGNARAEAFLEDEASDTLAARGVRATRLF